MWHHNNNGSSGARLMTQFLNTCSVHFSVDWELRCVHRIYIAPRPLRDCESRRLLIYLSISMTYAKITFYKNNSVVLQTDLCPCSTNYSIDHNHLVKISSIKEGLNIWICLDRHCQPRNLNKENSLCRANICCLKSGSVKLDPSKRFQLKNLRYNQRQFSS